MLANPRRVDAGRQAVLVKTDRSIIQAWQ